MWIECQGGKIIQPKSIDIRQRGQDWQVYGIIDAQEHTIFAGSKNEAQALFAAIKYSIQTQEWTFCTAKWKNTGGFRGDS